MKKPREKFLGTFGLLCYTLHVGGNKRVCEQHVVPGEPIVIGPFDSDVRISDVGLVAVVFKHPIPFPDVARQIPLTLDKGGTLTININDPVMTVWPEG